MSTAAPHTQAPCALPAAVVLATRSGSATVEIDGPAVETWADRMAAEHGYDDVSHTLEIFGRCAACRG